MNLDVIILPKKACSPGGLALAGFGASLAPILLNISHNP
jgi:hypothetical protein